MFPIAGMKVHDIYDDTFAYYTEQMREEGIYFKHTVPYDMIEVCYFDINERKLLQSVRCYVVQANEKLSVFQVYMMIKELYELFNNLTVDEFTSALLPLSYEFDLYKVGDSDTKEELDELLIEYTGVRNGYLEKSS